MARSVFTCSTCGATAAKWHGQCPGCSDWNTLVEEAAPAKVDARRRREGRRPGRAVPLREVSAEESRG